MNDNRFQDYNEFEKGELTKAARDDLLKFIYPTPDGNELVTIEDLQEAIDLEEHPVFLEGVAERLHILGVECTASDTDIISREIRRRFKERIGTDETSLRTLTNWARGRKTSVNRTSIINNYNLCYALEMNVKETANFFEKYFYTKPYNLKDTTEAIFFYCLLREKPYSTIRKMLDKAASFDKEKSELEETIKIEEQILDIEDDEEFICYLSAHCYSEELQYQRARAAIIQKIDNATDKLIGDKNLRLLSLDITDRITTSGKKAGDIRLPSEFIRNLPTDKTFSDIKLGKGNLTYDALRKALVVLILYEFYIEPERNELEEPTATVVKDRLVDFEAEVNSQLINCGLVPLYERNLFDAFILFCANSTFPLRTLQQIIELQYPKP